MNYQNNPENIEGAVRALRNALDGGGCVIALFPITDDEWAMSVAMSDNTPVQVLEQLSDALVLGHFEVKDLASKEDTEKENDKDA